MKVFGQLERAQLENLAADPATSITGNVWFNTVTGVVQVYNGSATRNVVFSTTALDIDSTGQVKAKDGTAASPSFRFQTSASGFYYFDASFPLAASVTGAVHTKFGANSLLVTPSAVGASNFIAALNPDNTNAASSAYMMVQTGGSSSGDPYIRFSVSGVTDYTLGIDNSVSDGFTLSRSSSLGTTNMLSIYQSVDYFADFNLEWLRVLSAGSDAHIQITAQAATFNAGLELVVTGSTGIPYLGFNDGTNAWLVGMDNADSDKFKIAKSSTVSFASNVHFTLTTVGALTIGNSATATNSHIFNGREIIRRFDDSATTMGNAYAALVVDNRDATDERMSGGIAWSSNGSGNYRAGIYGRYNSADSATDIVFVTHNGSAYAERGSLGRTGNWTFGVASGTQTHVLNGLVAVNSTSVNTGSLFNLLGTHPSTNAIQRGMDVNFTSTANATSGVYGIVSRNTTAASAFTCGELIAFLASDVTKGAGSTVTRQWMYYGDVPTQGSTGNVWGSDNATFSGNYVLHFTSTRESLFSGIVAFSAGLRTKVSTANTANPPTNAELVSAFGAAATVGSGFHAILNDNGAAANEYFVWSDGTNFWYTTGVKAV